MIVWGDYGRMDRKVFMGVVQVFLSDLDLSSMAFGWYKLFSTASMCEPPIFTPPTSPMVSPNQGFTRQPSSSSIHSLPAPHRSRQANMHKHSSLSQLGTTQASRGQPRVSRPRIEMIEDEGDYVWPRGIAGVLWGLKWSRIWGLMYIHRCTPGGDFSQETIAFAKTVLSVSWAQSIL